MPKNRGKFFVCIERKEDKISMFKRLLLVGMLAVMLVSPGFATVAGCENGSCVINCENENGVCRAKENQDCDYSTLGLYSGKLTLRARWSPMSYSCPSGEYLKATSESAECVVCEKGYYCGGVSDAPYDETNHGITRCDANYPYSDVGAKTGSECYQIVPVPCSKKNTYEGGHGKAVYEISVRSIEEYGEDRSNGKADCKMRQGQSDESCELVESDACEIVQLICDSGYRQEEVNGEKLCVSADVVECEAGTYLPKREHVCRLCPEDSYCEGSGEEKFIVSNTEDQGIVSCQDGLRSPQGATSKMDCGRVLHIGDDVVYLHRNKRTSPSLRVDIDGETWYANTKPTSEGVKTLSSGKSFHVKTKTGEYTVYSALCEDEECEE